MAAEAVAVAGVAAVEVAEAVVAAGSGSAAAESACQSLAARVVQVAPAAACPGVRAACAESHDEVAAESHTRHVCARPQPASGAGMAHWTAILVVMMLATCPGIAVAANSCDAMPKGPERTDCYLALSRSYQAQSDLAAAKARAQADAAWYRAITGEDPPRQQPQRRR